MIHSDSRDRLADQIAEILAKSSKEPGINEVIALMNISAESSAIQEMGAQLEVPSFFVQTTSSFTPIVRR